MGKGTGRIKGNFPLWIRPASLGRAVVCEEGRPSGSSLKDLGRLQWLRGLFPKRRVKAIRVEKGG
jgi:hypothetical protein